MASQSRSSIGGGYTGRLPRLAAGFCLAFVLSGCLSLAVQRSRIESALYPAPVHIAEDDSARWVQLASSVSIEGRNKVMDFPDPRHVDRIDSLTWIWPRVQGDLAVDLAPTPRLAVAGALSAGRVGGRTMWSSDLSMGLRWGPGRLCLRTDVGLRSRRSHYRVLYTESYTEGETTTSAAGQVRGTSHHRNAYVAVTLNSRRPGGSLNWFLGADAGGVTRLDFEVQTRVVSTNYVEQRGGVLLGVTGGVYRRIGSRVRALTGVRYGVISHTGNHQFGEPPEHRFLPFGELIEAARPGRRLYRLFWSPSVIRRAGSVQLSRR